MVKKNTDNFPSNLQFSAKVNAQEQRTQLMHAITSREQNIDKNVDWRLEGSNGDSLA